MAAWTLQEAKDNLKAALDAEKRILRSQEYRVGGDRNMNRRAELEQVAERIDFWSSEVRKLEKAASGKRGVKVRYGVAKFE